MHRTSRVRILLEAALLWEKKELCLGIVALLCLVSMTEHTCMYLYMYMYDLLLADGSPFCSAGEGGANGERELPCSS